LRAANTRGPANRAERSATPPDDIRTKEINKKK